MDKRVLETSYALGIVHLWNKHSYSFLATGNPDRQTTRNTIHIEHPVEWATLCEQFRMSAAETYEWRDREERITPTCGKCWSLAEACGYVTRGNMHADS